MSQLLQVFFSVFLLFWQPIFYFQEPQLLCVPSPAAILLPLTETKGEGDGEAAKPKGAVMMDADVGDDK